MESAIRRYGDKAVLWSAQGMLRLMPSAMQRLYRPTLDAIGRAVSRIIDDNLLSTFIARLTSPHLILTECTVIGRSYGELGCALLPYACDRSRFRRAKKEKYAHFNLVHFQVGVLFTCMMKPTRVVVSCAGRG